MIIYLIPLLMSTFEMETPVAIFVIGNFEKVKNLIIDLKKAMRDTKIKK